MHEGFWIPITGMVGFGLVIFAFIFFRYKSRLATQQTIRLALEKGNDMSPELLASLTEPKYDVARDLRRGMVSVAIGIGFVIFGFMVDEEEAVRPMIGIAMFPMFIGFAYLILWQLGKREKQS